VLTETAAPEWLRRTVLLLVFLFPLLAVSVKNGGSVVYALLFILSLGSLSNTRQIWAQLDPWEQRFLLGLVLFFIWLLITLINTDDFSSAGRKLERFVRLLMLIPIYVMLRRFGLNLVNTFILGAVAGCFLLLGQSLVFHLVMGHPVVNGVYHKIVLGDTAVLLAALVTAALLLQPHEKWQYLLGVLAAVAGLYVSVLSQTRGAWLLLPVLIVLWIWLYRSKITAKTLVTVLGLVLVAVTALAIWTQASVSRGIEAGINDLKVYQKDPSVETSLGARLNMWRDSLTLFKQNPILGAGLGDFKRDRLELMDQGKAIPAYGYGHAHSIYFHALATSGLIGLLILLLSIIGLPFWVFYRGWRQAQDGDARLAAFGGLTVVVAFAVFGLSEGWLARNPFMNIYAVTLLVFMSSLYAGENCSEDGRGEAAQS